MEEQTPEKPPFDRAAHLAKIRQVALEQKRLKKQVKDVEKQKKKDEFQQKVQNADEYLKQKKSKPPVVKEVIEESESEDEPEQEVIVTPKTKLKKSASYVDDTPVKHTVKDKAMKPLSAKEQYYKLKLDRLKAEESYNFEQNAIKVAKYNIDQTMQKNLMKQLMPPGW